MEGTLERAPLALSARSELGLRQEYERKRSAERGTGGDLDIPEMAGSPVRQLNGLSR
jgi:hypothetical protein